MLITQRQFLGLLDNGIAIAQLNSYIQQKPELFDGEHSEVEAALKKANINPAHVDSEEHMDSNMAKGWITAEDVAKAKEIIATVSAEKAAHLPEQMIQNIAKGRLGKFLKEVCLLNQEDIMDGKKTVREVLAAADPELKIVDFKRFTLKAE